jgi:outer membrane murein-binding lipoprotein Lpp
MVDTERRGLMSMITGKKQPDGPTGPTSRRLPQAPSVPMPPVREQATPNATYQRAHDFATRVFETEAEIEKLKLDGDQWRAKALAAEEQVSQLEKRIDQDRKTYDEHVTKITDAHDREMTKLSAQRQSDVDKLTDERDFYKLKLARTIERLHVAGKVVLDALDAEKAEKPQPKVDMQAIEAEVKTDKEHDEEYSKRNVL